MNKSRNSSFVIVGFPRCGTTALAANLGMHPDIRMHADEPGIFLENQDAEEIRAKFNDQEGRIVGEKTPYYIYDKKCLERIASTVDGIKVLYCIRHPVRQFESFYRHRVREFLEGKSWGIDCRKIKFEQFAFDRLEVGLLSLSRQLYEHYIQNLYDIFGREKVLFVIQERMFGDVRARMSRVFRFLGVRDYQRKFLRFSSNDFSTRIWQIDSACPEHREAVAFMLRYYKQSIDHVRDLIGDPLDEWKEVERAYSEQISGFTN